MQQNSNPSDGKPVRESGAATSRGSLLKRMLRGCVTGGLCLLPSLVSLAWMTHDQQAGARSAPLTEIRPLAMHIHLVHLREFDIREGRAIARYEFHNAAAEPLRIRSIKPSCGCVTVRLNQPAEGYASQQAGEFYLEVDTAAEAAGQHEYEVRIEYQLAEAEPESTQVRFRVDVPEKKVSVQPRALIFYQFSEESTQQQVTITDFRANRELELLSLQPQGSGMTLSAPARGEDAHGHRTWTFELTVSGSRPPGRQTGYIEIDTNDAEFPELRIPVLIYGPPEQAARKSPTPESTSETR